MGEFFKEHLESIMMISFLLATALGMYKVYVMFEKQAEEGIDIKTLEEEIIAMIEEIFRRGENPSKEELYKKIESEDAFDKERYKNFNQNRLNQILDRLYTQHAIEDYRQLAEKLRERK